MKKGHCIICHSDGVELSDEHVIPDAIGGYYHIYKVCKKCNSYLGDHVDSYLLKHWLIKGARHVNHLAGKTNKTPNPLTGEGSMEDGTKVRMEEDKSGKLVAHILPKSPEISSDGKTISISVDAKDEKLIGGMTQKAIKKMGLIPGTYQMVTNKTVQEIPKPTIQMQTSIDLKNYKIGLLKIAYEFTVDKFPAYYKDPMALLYSDILHNAAINRLNEVAFEGDGLFQSDLTLLNHFIDYNNTNRHILMLLNIKNKLYCMVKLFHNTMCQLIRMSDKEYKDTNIFILALNDFVKHECKFYNQHELVEQCVKSEAVEVRFSDEINKQLQAEIQLVSHHKQVGFACNVQNENVFFDTEGNILCTQNQLVASLENVGNVEIINDGNKQTSIYNIPDGYFLLLMPTRKLIKPLSLVYVNEIQKL